jgi:hypothetical protein
MDTAVLENSVLLRDTWLLTQKERVYFEPDADFYNSISADEFKKKAQEVVKNAYIRNR